MSELRAGGLAIIIGGSTETVGIVVTTIEFVPAGKSIRIDSGKLLKNGGSNRWLIHSEEICVTLSDGTTQNDFSFLPASMLLPIDGKDFSHEDERRRELIHG